MFVVIWEPRHGHGGGHQAVLEQGRAEYVRRQMSRLRPDDSIRIESAHEHAAAAVAERGQRRQQRDAR